jgi:large subunit ribosomal protein L30
MTTEIVEVLLEESQTMERKVKVTLKHSGIGRPRKQKDTLRGLGLTRLHKTVILQDTPEVRGMLTKVIHLIEVEKG